MSELVMALTTVPGLRKDRCDAREKPAIKPVPEDHVEAVLPHLPATVCVMVLVQRLSACRPQDVVEMRPGDIDQAGPVWEYRPGRHKGEHHARERIVFLGPRAQELLKPYLQGLRPDEYVFSPIRSEQRRLAEQRRQQGRLVLPAAPAGPGLPTRPAPFWPRSFGIRSRKPGGCWRA